MSTAILEPLAPVHTDCSRRASQAMQALRAATGQTHKSVEQKTPFFKSNFDHACYLRWTQDMLGFYQAFEAALCQSPLLQDGVWVYNARAVLLRNDLQRLGEPPEKMHPAHGKAYIPDLSDAMKALGALYVVEGSALGGQVLAARMAKALGITAQSGASFYQPNGPDPRPCWERFQALVGSLCTDRHREAAMVDAAVEMFHAFDAWLLECGWSA